MGLVGWGGLDILALWRQCGRECCGKEDLIVGIGGDEVHCHDDGCTVAVATRGSAGCVSLLLSSVLSKC
jgi:hypothetical protein